MGVVYKNVCAYVHVCLFMCLHVILCTCAGERLKLQDSMEQQSSNDDSDTLSSGS